MLERITRVEDFVRKLRMPALGFVLLGAATLVGCGDGAYYAGVAVAPPPPLVYGPVGAAPGPEYIWTDGYYEWDGSNWFWRPGSWARPPRRGYVWRKPYYEHYRNGYRMRPGRWERH